MIIDLSWDKLPAQAECYNDITTNTLLFSGGLGCISEKDILHTTDGAKPVGDILRPSFYFSKNDQHQLSLFPGTAPYPKGKDYLYRVVHEQGEFEVSLYHRIYVGNGKYIPFYYLLYLFEKNSSFSIPSPTNLEYSQLMSLLSDQHLMGITSDFLYHYGEYIHQYGQQLPSLKENDPDVIPLPFDAHIADSYISKYKHNHLCKENDHRPRQDYKNHSVGPEQAFLYEGFYSKFFGHILQDNRQYQQSPSTSLFHHLALKSCLRHILTYSYSRPNTTKIISIEKTTKQWFFDLHVFGSNNYLSGNAYHHNSGKTHYLCQKAIQLSVLNRGYPGGILVPTYPDFKKDVYPTFDQIFFDLDLKENVHYWYHKTDKTYKFIWNEQPLYIFTGEKPIAGPNLAYCLINEFSLIQYIRIKEMIRRVRIKGAPNKQRILAGTPEDVHGWVEEFVEVQEKSNQDNPNHFKIVYADTSENHHLDDEYREHLRSMLDDQAFKVFAQGQIVKLHGDYFYYSFERKKNVKPTTINQNFTIHVGMDFNVGKMAAVFANVIDNRDKMQREVHIFDEILLSGDSDTYKMADAIKNRFDPKDVLITCDASGANRKTTGMSDVKILQDYGFTVRFRRSNPKLRDRQILMNGLLSKEQIIIDPKCKNLIKDLEKVQQNKSDFNKIKDKDDRLTHFSDALDYLCDWEFNLNLRRSRTL